MELEGGLGASGFTGVLPVDRDCSDLPYSAGLRRAHEAATLHFNGGCERRAGVHYKVFELLDEEDLAVTSHPWQHHRARRRPRVRGLRREPAIEADVFAVVTVKVVMYAEEGTATNELWTDTPMAASKVKVYTF